MATTKVTTGGITDATIATADIANDAVTNAKVADDAVGVAELSATGTASSSTFLRGDNSWAAVTSTTINNNADNRIITGSGTANTLEAESSITYDGTKILNISSSAGGFFQGTDTDGGVGLVEMGNGNVALQADTGNAIANSKIQFLVDNSEKMTLLDSGKLGIGTTSPAEKLHVYEASGAAVIRLEPGSGNGQAFNILSTYGSAANTGNFSIRNESGNAFLDLQHNEGTPRMQVRNGTGNVHAQIDANGIKFNGDTAAANGLHDYEYGSWTPTYAPTGGVSGASYSTQTGQYVKIGRFVMVQFYYTITSTTSSGNFRISGLPYNANSYGAGSLMSHTLGLNTNRWYVLHTSNDGYIYLYGSENGAAWETATATNAAHHMIGTISYYTTS